MPNISGALSLWFLLKVWMMRLNQAYGNGWEYFLANQHKTLGVLSELLLIACPGAPIAIWL